MDLDHALKNLPKTPLPLSLQHRVLFRIQKAEEKRERIVFLTFGIVGVASVLALIPTLSSLVNGLQTSGVYSYLSLMFTEGFGAITFLKELTYTLVESIPLSALTLTLFFLFTSLMSLRKIAREMPSSFFTISVS